MTKGKTQLPPALLEEINNHQQVLENIIHLLQQEFTQLQITTDHKKSSGTHNYVFTPRDSSQQVQIYLIREPMQQHVDLAILNVVDGQHQLHNTVYSPKKFYHFLTDLESALWNMRT